MPRELTSHKVNGLNEALRIQVLDEPGQGNSCHEYRIVVTDPGRQEAGHNLRSPDWCCDIQFQNGPIAEVGVNGISNESLLAVVEDRLAGFQSGEYACEENALALTALRDAMTWLHKRTRDRVARGVEGTHTI